MYIENSCTTFWTQFKWLWFPQKRHGTGLRMSEPVKEMLRILSQLGGELYEICDTSSEQFRGKPRCRCTLSPFVEFPRYHGLCFAGFVQTFTVKRARVKGLLWSTPTILWNVRPHAADVHSTVSFVEGKNHHSYRRVTWRTKRARLYFHSWPAVYVHRPERLRLFVGISGNNKNFVWRLTSRTFSLFEQLGWQLMCTIPVVGVIHDDCRPRTSSPKIEGILLVGQEVMSRHLSSGKKN